MNICKEYVYGPHSLFMFTESLIILDATKFVGEQSG